VARKDPCNTQNALQAFVETKESVRLVRELLLNIGMDTHPRCLDRESSIAGPRRPFGANDESAKIVRNPFNQVFIANAMLDLQAAATLCVRAGGFANRQRSRSGNTALARASRLRSPLL